MLVPADCQQRALPTVCELNTIRGIELNNQHNINQINKHPVPQKKIHVLIHNNKKQNGPHLRKVEKK
jgi:hypothetical protein